MSEVTLQDDAAWVAALEGAHVQREAAVARLHDVVRRGLGRAMARRGVSAADLDDFAQNAVLHILERLHRFDSRSRFSTWALSVAIRVAFTELRRRHWQDRSLDAMGDNRRGGEAASLAARNTAAPETVAAREDLLAALRVAIAERLTDRQRQAVLSELSGMPQSVLAERLGVTTNALYKLHHDARRKLKAALEVQGYSAEEVRTLLAEASQS